MIWLTRYDSVMHPAALEAVAGSGAAIDRSTSSSPETT